MNRRVFLAALATLTAGCTGSQTDTSPEPTTTPTSTPAPTTESPDTPTDQPSTPRPTDSPTTDETTETTTDTPTPHPAERYTRRAREHLDAAVDAYVSQRASSNVEFDDVTASTEFSPGPVQTDTNEARDDIARAEDEDDGTYAETIDDLRTVRVFIDRSAVLQSDLYELYRDVEDALSHLRDGSYRSASDFAESLDGRPEGASDALDTIRSETDSSSMDAIGGLSADDYAGKLEQFDAEIEAFATFETVLPDFVEALDRSDTGYDYAETLLADVVDSVTSTPRPDSLAALLDEVECVGSAFENAMDLMSDASAARQDGNEATAENLECDALETLDECDDASAYRAADALEESSAC